MSVTVYALECLDPSGRDYEVANIVNVDPAIVAAPIEREYMTDVEEVIILALCESEALVLRPFVTYQFHPIAGCKRCEEMLEEHNKDWGTNLQPVQPE